MSDLRSPRPIRANRDPCKDGEPHASINTLGFRVRSRARTAFAALKAIRREHPVLVHVLYTYLSVTGLLLALTAAIAVRG